MLKKLSIIAVAAAFAASALPAQAQPRVSPEYRLDRQQMRDMSREVQRPGRDVNPRAADDGFPGGHRGGKMSPDERRALRRQINEANQDIYAPRR